MARPVSWLPRLPALVRSVSESVRSHYASGDLERLFQIQPRSAQMLLGLFPTVRVGKSLLVERKPWPAFLPALRKPRIRTWSWSPSGPGKAAGRKAETAGLGAKRHRCRGDGATSKRCPRAWLSDRALCHGRGASHVFVEAGGPAPGGSGWVCGTVRAHAESRSQPGRRRRERTRRRRLFQGLTH